MGHSETLVHDPREGLASRLRSTNQFKNKKITWNIVRRGCGGGGSFY